MQGGLAPLGSTQGPPHTRRTHRRHFACSFNHHDSLRKQHTLQDGSILAQAATTTLVFSHPAKSGVQAVPDQPELLMPVLVGCAGGVQPVSGVSVITNASLATLIPQPPSWSTEDEGSVLSQHQQLTRSPSTLHSHWQPGSAEESVKQPTSEAQQPVQAQQTTSLDTQACILRVKQCSNVHQLQQACKLVHQQHLSSTPQPGLVLAVAAQLKRLLTPAEHDRHEYDGEEVRDREQQASSRRRLADSIKAVCWHICTWVLKSDSPPTSGRKQVRKHKQHSQRRTSTAQHTYQPHHAITILHSLAWAVKTAGAACVQPQTVAYLVPALLDCHVVHVQQHPAHARSPNSRATEQVASGRLVMPQLLTAAWSVAVIGTQHLPPQLLNRLLTWCYASSAPMLHHMTCQQLTRLMWALAALVSHGDQQAAAQPAALHPSVVAHVVRPGQGWWAALEAATLAGAPPPLSSSHALSTSDRGSNTTRHSCSLLHMSASSLALCCWAAGHLSVRHARTGQQQWQQVVPSAGALGSSLEQHAHISHRTVAGQQQQQGVSGQSEQCGYPSHMWVQLLLRCVGRWLAHHQAPLAPEAVAQLVSGLSRLHYQPPAPLLAQLLSSQPSEQALASQQHNANPRLPLAPTSAQLQTLPEYQARDAGAMHPAGRAVMRPRPFTVPSTSNQQQAEAGDAALDGSALAADGLLPAPQLLQVLQHSTRLYDRLPPATLHMLCSSLEACLDTCSAGQMVGAVACLQRLGLPALPHSLSLMWLAELHARRQRLTPSNLLLLLQVLRGWDMWPGRRWLQEVLLATQPSLHSYTPRQLQQLMDHLQGMGITLDAGVSVSSLMDWHGARAATGANGHAPHHASQPATGSMCMVLKQEQEHQAASGQSGCLDADSRVLLSLSSWHDAVQRHLARHAAAGRI